MFHKTPDPSFERIVHRQSCACRFPAAQLKRTQKIERPGGKNELENFNANLQL